MNPYTPSSSMLFYGRDDLVEKLLNDEQSGQSNVLVGGRRCGKTNVLRHLTALLAQKANSSDARPIHWPCVVNFMGVDLHDYQSALTHMAHSIHICLGQLDYDPNLAPNEISGGTSLEKWLGQVDSWLSELGHSGFALLVDEIEAIFHHEWCDDLMAFLRRLDDTTFRTRIWILLVGADRLDRYRSKRDGSPPLNTHRRERLRDLDYLARRQMAIEPFAAANRPPLDDETMAELDRLAGGNVWILTLLLERLFAADEAFRATLDHAAEDLRDELVETFQRWGQPIDELDGWKLFETIASSDASDSRLFTNDTKRSLRHLFEYQALVHRRGDGKIELGPDLFREWAESNNKIETIESLPRRSRDREIAPPGSYRYDVAISYALPQRPIARDLSDMLRQQNLEVFYDVELGDELWGVDLNQHLPHTYNRASQVAVLLVSEEYARRHWPQIEQRAAITRAINDSWDAILIVTVDGTGIPEVPSSVVVKSLTPGGTNLEAVALDLSSRIRKTGGD